MNIVWVLDFLGDVWGLQIMHEWPYGGSDFEFTGIVISGPDFLDGQTSIPIPIFMEWFIDGSDM
jgi:hypothetical protein